MKIAIIGLGYVGLPLLCHFSTSFQTFGMDINEKRVKELAHGTDSKRCINEAMLSNLKQSTLTNEWTDLYDCDMFIITAPTPIDDNKQPDLSSLKDICTKLGNIIKPGIIIVFESTVAPGTTEEICVPIIEKSSSLKVNEDFSVGFSPERINVGDSKHTLSNVPKIVSASNGGALSVIAEIYKTALGCEIVKASSIKTAEAAKLYENVQRDVLIALANQYSEYCSAEGIDIAEVTKCAATKWNFAEVYPGLVGGHCIGVDPYYLLAKAKELDVKMDLVEKAREVNEAETNKATLNILSRLKHNHANSVLLVGLTYKPDTSDLRNSKALEIARNIHELEPNVTVYDPHIRRQELPVDLQTLYSEELPSNYSFDAVITLVNHSSLQVPKGRIFNLNINE